MRKQIYIAVLMLLVSATAGARGVYQAPEAFLQQVFAGAVPAARVLWLDAAQQRQLREILGHEYPALRIRYWTQSGRSAWILDEIGKEQPITAGVVIANGKIEQIKVLVFRESRGWEVRNDFFTEQFKGASLGPDTRLERHIDGVAGATLSVRAMQKMATVALYLSALDAASGARP